MVFSATTTKDGLIQDCEFWTNLGDTGISGDATLLKVFTSRLNQSFDRLMPKLLPFLKFLGWDDTNTTGTPTKSANIVSGTGSYQTLIDSNSLDVLVITDVAILQSSSATNYAKLERITLDDDRAALIISPNTSNSGIPSAYVVMNKTVYFDVIPNYSATNGIKVFFSREQSRFVSTDTTKEPGFPVPFHNLLSLYASYDWLLVNKPDNTALLTRLEAEISRREGELEDWVRAQSPARSRMTGSSESNK